MSQQLLAKQHQLEESIREQRQEVARLREQMGGTQGGETNPALKALEVRNPTTSTNMCVTWS